MKILLVHGVGHCEATPNYYSPWRNAITAGLQASGYAGVPDYVEFTYDALFDQAYSGPGIYAAALAELAATTAEHAILDPIHALLNNLLHPSREYLGDVVRWRAGMVAQFAVEDGLRSKLCDAFFAVLQQEQPDLVAAHSLGSLLSFDFLHNDSRAVQVTPFAYLTFGSQINNPFIRSRVWPGRLTLPGVASWTHLYNPQDHVFTADIALPDTPNFLEVTTPSAAGHSPVRTEDGPGYLDHPETLRQVWPVLAQLGTAPAMAARKLPPRQVALARSLVKPERRALLVGINNYPDPANRLDGCENDTFLISSLLQEHGFEPENIRMLLNERATADGIRERLAWLLEDVGDGMERVFFYSGHGAQLPGYNAAEKVDHVDECLVPYDFAWTKETAITDDDFYKMYSDLPFSARFFAILDCCHAGGMTRDGMRKIRGLSAPDDIRHRLLRWNKKEQMWEERELPKLNSTYGGTETERRAMIGSNGATYRLGRGMTLRRHISKAEAKALVKQKRGLYLPTLLEACGERQVSYEYRHGSVSYGAFTYSLTKNLRANPAATFTQLIDKTRHSLQTLGYDQRPELVGPKKVISAPVASA